MPQGSPHPFTDPASFSLYGTPDIIDTILKEPDRYRKGDKDANAYHMPAFMSIVVSKLTRNGAKEGETKRIKVTEGMVWVGLFMRGVYRVRRWGDFEAIDKARVAMEDMGDDEVEALPDALKRRFDKLAEGLVKASIGPGRGETYRKCLRLNDQQMHLLGVTSRTCGLSASDTVATLVQVGAIGQPGVARRHETKMVESREELEDTLAFASHVAREVMGWIGVDQ